MVSRDQEAENVEHVVFAQVLLIHAQHFGRRSGVDFGVVVELEPIDITEVARFIDSKND